MQRLQILPKSQSIKPLKPNFQENFYFNHRRHLWYNFSKILINPNTINTYQISYKIYIQVTYDILVIHC